MLSVTTWPTNKIVQTLKTNQFVTYNVSSVEYQGNIDKIYLANQNE